MRNSIMSTWIFERKALAKHYLDALDIGIMNRLALFAPRRRGKTLFLVNDIATLAEENNYFPVYASLWDNLDSPHIPILEALSASLNIIKKRGQLTSLLAAPIQKLSLGNAFIKGDIEFAGKKNKPTGNELAEISSLINQIATIRKKKKLLLLLDEIQYIATDEKFTPLAFAIRTAADKNHENVKIIFTGSSRTGMCLLFNKQNTAFYNSVERIDFPDLGTDFLAFCKNKLKKDYKISVSLENLVDCLDTLDQSPFWFVKVLHKMILHKIKMKEALEVIMDEIIDLEDYAGMYRQMKPLDKLVLVSLGGSSKDTFSENRAKYLSKRLGREIKIPTIQYTINKLVKLQLITKMGRAEYVIEKPLLKEYVLSRLESELMS